MTSYRHVLVGTDGSPTATHAVTTAAQAASRLGAPLTIITAWQRHPQDPPPPSEEAHYPGGGVAGTEAQWAIDVTSDAAGIARRLGVEEVHQEHPVGAPADALVAAAHAHPDALLVAGTWGLDRAAERLLGNVPHQLTHHSPADLLLVRSPQDDLWEAIVLATDGSPTAMRAVQRGLSLARALDLPARLCTVAASEARGTDLLEKVAAELDADLGLEVLVGNAPARALVKSAREGELLVIGNKGMSGPTRLLGSVSNRITHDIPTDLLLVNTTR
jgi:nucleotide-binding universal stress UspA family protein